MQEIIKVLSSLHKLLMINSPLEFVKANLSVPKTITLTFGIGNLVSMSKIFPETLKEQVSV